MMGVDTVSFYVGPIGRGQPRCCGDSDASGQGWEESGDGSWDEVNKEQRVGLY